MLTVDIVTVTYGTWDTYTKRMLDMVDYYTSPHWVNQWTICDNNSSDWERLKDYKPKRQPGLRVSLIPAQENIGDLPRYNILFRKSSAEVIVVISTDVRIFSREWINQFKKPFLLDKRVGMVGPRGPGINMGPEHADPAVGGGWHWIPQLLVDRGIEFDNCGHVQTHCFAVRKQAFLDAGGFWVPEANFLDKGHLVAGEVSMGARMRAAGWKLDFNPPRMYHYGSAAASAEALDGYDGSRGWKVPWN